MDLEAQWNSAAGVLVAMITTYGLRVVGAIVILIAGWMAARFVYAGIVRLCEQSSRIDRTVTIFLANGTRYAVLVFTFVAVLTTFGIATTSFVAVLGAISIAIGFALRRARRIHSLSKNYRQRSGKLVRIRTQADGSRSSRPFLFRLRAEWK